MADNSPADPSRSGDEPSPSLYPGGPTQYEKAPVPASFTNLLGQWEGPFRTFDQQVKA